VDEKVYGYITRLKDGKPQVLVFKHAIPEAGIQIPKGTVNEDENAYQAVIREMVEETGLRNFKMERLIAEDNWKNDDGALHHRFFYKINGLNAPEKWDHQPTGGGDEEGLIFHFFWISSRDEVELIRGHGDYLDNIFT